MTTIINKMNQILAIFILISPFIGLMLTKVCYNKHNDICLVDDVNIGLLIGIVCMSSGFVVLFIQVFRTIFNID